MTTTPATLPPCHIEALERNGLVRLEAVLDARDIAAGEYVLDVRAGGSGNVATTRQSGEFDVAELDDGRLATVHVTAGAGGWSARLQVFSQDGRLLCTAARP